MGHRSFGLVQNSLLEAPHPCHGSTIQGLPDRDSGLHRLRALLRLARRILGEVTLDIEPTSPPPGSVEQDEEDGHRLLHPEVVVPDVHVKGMVRARYRERLG